MHIFPAIDLKNGQCVRLRQGRADDVTTYSEDPVAMARRWASEGATWLHVVDLDGAFQGRPCHTAVIAEMVKAVQIPVQVGGGLRSAQDAEQLLSTGVRRVIFGTRAVTEPKLIPSLVAVYGDAIVVGIDARDGRVQVRGWVETTDVTATELAQRVAAAGVRTIVYTDTSRDGMLGGVNTGAVDAMCQAVTCDVVASGGVSSAADVSALCNLKRANLAGAIVGKALYEGRTTLPELIAAAR